MAPSPGRLPLPRRPGPIPSLIHSEIQSLPAKLFIASIQKELSSPHVVDPIRNAVSSDRAPCFVDFNQRVAITRTHGQCNGCSLRPPWTVFSGEVRPAIRP